MSERSKNLQFLMGTLQCKNFSTTLNSMWLLSYFHSFSISALISLQMCSQERIIDSPLEFWHKVLSLQMMHSLASLSRAIVMGTLIKIIEKQVGISLMHTFEMNIPIDEAETVVRLSSKVCGSTCILSSTECDFFSFLQETR